MNNNLNEITRQNSLERIRALPMSLKMAKIRFDLADEPAPTDLSERLKEVAIRLQKAEPKAPIPTAHDLAEGQGRR